MICHYHPHAQLERTKQEIAFADGVGGRHPMFRVVLRCTSMLSDTLRCPFTAVEYDITQTQVRRCYRCGKKLSVTEDGTLTVKRCRRCISEDNHKHQQARARRREARL